MERLNKRIYVYEDDNCYDIPETIPEFFKFWQEKLSLVPKQYKNSVRIEIDAQERYEFPYLNVEVSYERPETDEEYNQRISDKNLSEDIARIKMIKQYEHLKKELGYE